MDLPMEQPPIKTTNMSNEKTVIFTTNQTFEAELIKQQLENKGIETFIMNKKDSSYLFGEIELIVNKEKESEARKIIESMNEDQ